MRSRVQYVLYFVTIITFTEASNLKDFDLPGIFSRSICDNDELREKLSPLCHCREKTKITDIHSLCRSHVEFGNCIHSEIQKGHRSSQYMTNVFSNKRFKQIMNHLCRKESDAAGITGCTKPNIPMHCNALFNHLLHNISENNISEKFACSITERTSECYWRIYENECSPTVRYFWSKLSESYMTMRCSKYSSKSKGDKCTEIKYAFHPNPKTHSREECHNAVHTMRQCFELEKLSSLHHEDVWMTLEFELDRYIHYERFRCDTKIEKDRNHHCEYPHRKRLEHCINGVYMGEFNKQTERLRQGENVTVQEICSVYDGATRCIEKVLKDCPVNAVHINSLFCGSMPTSCHCPVNLEAEIAARSSKSSRLTTTSRTFMICLSYVLLLAQNI